MFPAATRFGRPQDASGLGEQRLMRVVKQARLLVGTKFAPHGRNPGAALDCGGVVCAYEKAGFRMKDGHDYLLVPSAHSLLRMLRANGRQIGLSDAVPGCTVALWLTQRTRPQHLAVLTERGTMIHCTSPSLEQIVSRLRSSFDTGGGKFIEESLSQHWRRRVHSAWVPKEISWPL